MVAVPPASVRAGVLLKQWVLTQVVPWGLGCQLQAGALFLGWPQALVRLAMGIVAPDRDRIPRSLTQGSNSRCANID
jgi:hypothetical protein